MQELCYFVIYAVTHQTNMGVAEQKSQTDQVATALNQMVATVTEVARSAGSSPTPDVRAQPGTPRNRRRHEPSSGLRGLHPRHGNQRSAC